MILRCEACAAPLRRTAFIVRCAYCGTENRIGTHPDAAEQAARMVVAAEESRAAGPEANARCAQIYSEYEACAARAMKGDREAGLRAVECMEGYIRMTYMPTMKMVNAMNPEDPTVIDMLRQMDGVVDDACRNVAEALKVPYIPSAERFRIEPA